MEFLWIAIISVVLVIVSHYFVPKRKPKEKVQFLVINDSDVEAIAALYQNCVVRWMHIDAPELTSEELHEQIALFFADVAREFYKREQRDIEGGAWKGIRYLSD